MSWVFTVTRLERQLIPQNVIRQIPRKFRPSDIATRLQRAKTRFRIFWKYEKRPRLELWGGVFGFIGFGFFIQFRTPIEHYLQLPSTDPNKFLRDPYAIKQVNEQRRRKYELQENIEVERDEVSHAIGSYTNVPGTTQTSGDGSVAAA